MKTYRVALVDRVTRDVLIQAKSESEALEKYHKSEGFESKEIQESDCEYYQEPFVDGCIEDDY